MTTKLGLERMILIRDMFRAAVMFVKAFPDHKESMLDLPMLECLVNESETIVDCIENDKFLLSGWYASGSEIWEAMDIPWYCIARVAETGSIDYLLQDLEVVDQLPIPKDLCTLHRLFIKSLEVGDLPIPSAFVTLLQPCDGLAGTHNAMLQYEDWRKVPTFSIDPPAGTGEDQIRYVAEQFKQMVPWLEKLSGKKMDWDHLRKICENGNKMVKLFWEFNELKRNKPCPVHSWVGEGFAGAITIVPGLIGTQKGVDFCQGWVDHAKEIVKSGKGALKNEKIRIFWFDCSMVYKGGWGLDAWLEEEMNANVVMNFTGCGSYSLIDTSSEDAMFYGLAKRSIMDSSMIRHSRPSSQLMLDELVTMVKDYKIDVVIGGGHMGHKDQQTSVGLVREKCRELGVPYLFLGLDNYDPRYMPLEEVQEKISRFFKTMGLGEK